MQPASQLDQDLQPTSANSGHQPASQPDKLPLSVVILTKNEEVFLERCLRSVSWADEQLILDSGSTDRTKEIAAALGAKVYEQNHWLGWSAQRTKAISLAQHDWVFVIDVDEVVTDELAAAIQAVMRQPRQNEDGYSIDRRDDFHGVLLPSIRRRSKLINCVRLFNRRYSAYDPTMIVHEEVRFTGKAIPLAGVLLHWRGWTINDQIASLNRYATIEAEALYSQGHRATMLSIAVRPILRFLWCYLAKGCCTKGIQGLNYSIVRAIGEYVRHAKLWEMEHVPQPVLHPPKSLYQIKAK